jgi:hypothetical protein
MTRAFDALALACRAAIVTGSAPAPEPLSDASLSLARRHRVLPLIDTLVDERSAGWLRANAQQQLQHAQELRRIAEHFDGQIDFLVLKGPLLAQQVYGRLAARESQDLDLLVRPKEVADALRALAALGYETPVVEPNAFRHHVKTQHEFGLVHQRTQQLVELQWAWAQRHYAVSRDIDQCFELAISVTLAGTTFRTFRAEDTLLYLALHAAKHGWSHLSLLTDFAAAALRLPVDWQRLRFRAAAMGLTRLLAVATALSRLLFAVELPLSMDSKAGRLAERIMNRWQNDSAHSPSFVEYMRQRERWSDRARIAWRVAITPTPSDLSWLNPGDRWFALHYVLRPARLMLRFTGIDSAPSPATDREAAATRAAW